MLQKKCIAFIGGGNMTHSLLKGMLQKGYSPEFMIVSNRTQEKLSALVDALRHLPEDLQAFLRSITWCNPETRIAQFARASGSN